MRKVIRIGTRGSKLALIQTEMVLEELKKKYPDWEMERVIISTKGDQMLNKPLTDFLGKGVFITEFEEALLTGQIDLAVHSSKDMPMELAEGLVIAGVLPRADARDVLVTRKGLLEAKKLLDITVGTGSVRRQIQLKKLYPDINCVSIRGNVPTRLQKIRDGEVDAVLLAAAGLSRLGMLKEAEFDYRFFSYEEMLPAGGQGIIAMEGRDGDGIARLAGAVSDEKAYYELETERSIMKQLEAGCHEPIGIISCIEQEEISVQVIREKNGIFQKQEGRAPVRQRLELARKLVNGLE